MAADKFDYLRGGAFVVAFLILGVWSLPAWLIADTVFSAFSGIGLYIRPEVTIQLQTQSLKIDVMHCHLNRMFGSFLLGSALTWALCRSSKDSNVTAALLWSRVVGILCLLAIIVTGHFGNRKLFTDKHLWFGVLGNALWWLANVIQLLKTRPKVSIGPVAQSRGITLVCNLNLVALTLVSLALMAFPLLTVGIQGRKMDKYHLHTAKCVGALAMMWNIFMWFVPRFVNKRDVKAAFGGQILTVVLIYLAKAYMQYTSKILSREQVFAWTVIYLPLLLLPMNGLLLAWSGDKAPAISTEALLKAGTTKEGLSESGTASDEHAQDEAKKER